MTQQPLDLHWFLRLRWAVLATQLLVFLAGDRWKLPLAQLMPALLLSALQLALNGVALRLTQRRRVPVPRPALPGLMVLDALALTVMLLVSVQDSHALLPLYLVNVALAAMLLPRGAMWGVVFTSVAGIAAVLAHEPAEVRVDPLRWQLPEMGISFTASAVLIAFLVRRTGRMLQARADALQARQRQAELGTLAAGAAHELASPLSIIAVTARELLDRLEREHAHPDAIADARLVREQVGRCREILQGLSADAGVVTGEAISAVRVGDALEAALAALPERSRVRRQPGPADALEVPAPRQALVQAIRAVVKNALEAGPGEVIVTLVAKEAARVRVVVNDGGQGMGREALARAGEPFFTTKPAGQGTGLGLFFTRTLLEHLGGQLRLSSSPGVGTTAELWLPLQQARVVAAAAGA